MHTPLRYPALVLCALGFAAGPVSSFAQTVSDTFDVGSPATVGNDAADLSDVAWAANRTTLSIKDDSTGIGSGNALDLASTSNFQNAWANFSSVALTEGSPVVFSLDFRVTSGTSNNASGLRFGLGDGVNGSYIFSLGVGSATGGAFVNNGKVGSGGAGGSDTAALITTGTAQAINNLTKHTLKITFTRLNAGSVGMTALLDNTYTFSATDTAPVVDDGFPLITSFSQIQLGTGDVTQDLRYDNISVSTIPEPSTYAMLVGVVGLGLATGARRRRS